MRKLLFKLPLLLLIVILSCTDNGPTHVDTFPAIYGTVLDSLGNPLKDAEVRVIFDLVPFESSDTLTEIGATGLYYITPNPFTDIARLMLASEKGGNVKVNLYSGVGFHNLKKNLWQENIQPGNHALSFSMQNPGDTAQNLPNGLYTIAMEHIDSTYSHVIFYNNPYESGAIVKTDSQGKFVLGYGIFEKVPLPRINENGIHLGYFQIGDMATLYIVKGTLETRVLTKIETTKVKEITFTLE